LTQSGTPVSLASPLVAAPAKLSGGRKTGYLSQDRGHASASKAGKVAKQFAELLRKAAAEQAADKSLMGQKPRAGEALDGAQTGLAVAAVNPAATPVGMVEEPGNGVGAAASGPVPVSAGAADEQAAGAGNAAAGAAGPATPNEEERLTWQSPGAGPGGRPGEPPGSGGQIPGPDKGSITQVQVTDGAEKPGSPAQGPGTGFPAVELADLNLGDEGHAAGEKQGAPSGEGGANLADAGLRDAEPPEGAPAKADPAAAKPTEPTAAPAAAGAGPAHASDAKTVNIQQGAGPLGSAMVEHFEAYAKGGAPSVKLILQPEHLGEVHVRLTLIDGSINAMVRVDNPQVREAVAQQLEIMRASLAEQGIKIEKLEVSVAGSYDHQRPDADEWASSGQWQGQADPQSRGQDGSWALPETYRSLFQGGSDRAEVGQVADPQGDGAVERVTALDVRA